MNIHAHVQNVAISATAVLLALSIFLPAQARTMSFEGKSVPENFSIDRGKLSISAQKYKLGSTSLKIDWKAGAQVVISHPEGIAEASASSNGGLTAWIYNETRYATPSYSPSRTRTGRSSAVCLSAWTSKAGGASGPSSGQTWAWARVTR